MIFRVSSEREKPQRTPPFLSLATYHQPLAPALAAALHSHPISENRKVYFNQAEDGIRDPQMRPQVSAHLPRLPDTERTAVFETSALAFGIRSAVFGIGIARLFL